MKLITLGLRYLTVLLKVAFGRKVANALDGNSNFTTPDPTVAEINTASDTLEKAYNEAEDARQIAKEKTAILNQREKEFNDILTKAGNYVENTSNGDETKILSAGMTPKSKAVYSDAVLPKPENLSVSTSDIANEVDFHWDKVEGANSYEIQICMDPLDTNKWEHAKNSTSSISKIGGLISGQRYWFRVAALNTNGESGWSNPVKITVP